MTSTALFGPTEARGEVIRDVTVAGARVVLGDLVSGVGAAASFDVGPAPALLASRVFSRAELADLVRAAGATVARGKLSPVRVARQVRTLDAVALESELRRAPLPKGVALVTVRAPRSSVVAAGYDAVAVDLGKLARRTGHQRVTARVQFLRGAEPLTTITVPVEVNVDGAAAKAAVTRGQPLELLVRRVGIEIVAAALAGADGDVGDVVPVTVRPTGRVVKAEITAGGRALFVEGS